MKAGLVAVAAAMASGVVAHKHNHARHNHAAFHAPRNLVTGGGPDATCDCKTVYYTTTGEPTRECPDISSPSPIDIILCDPDILSITQFYHINKLTRPVYFPPPPATTAAPEPTVPTVPTVPTPYVTTFPSTGIYTIPATTITITEETTVCAATQTPIPSGTHTAGGVTTVVVTSTDVVCPYATTVTNDEGVVTSTILTTTYVCPTAGTYTIAPLTTTVSESTIWVYPIPATYPAGTYTQDEVTTTVTQTNAVYVCPYTSDVPAPTYAPAPAPTYVPVPEPTKVPEPPKVPETPKTPTLGGGKHWAITYTPYTPGGDCKDAGSVNSDVADIAKKGFKALRVYSTDCSALENIGGAAEKNGLKLIIGVFISNTGTAGAQEQITQISKWAKWGLVDLVVVGNESIMNGYVSGPELAAFIQSSHAAFKSSGYNGPVTTTEPLNVWQANTGSLCGAVDVVGCNIHPFFNPDVTAASAGPFVANQLAIVDDLCPGKTGINLETGWPSAGSNNGAAVPGVAEQATAIKSIAAAVGDRSVILSYANDDWKEPGPFDCEQFWGAVQLFTL